MNEVYLIHTLGLPQTKRSASAQNQPVYSKTHNMSNRFDCPDILVHHETQATHFILFSMGSRLDKLLGELDAIRCSFWMLPHADKRFVFYSIQMQCCRSSTVGTVSKFSCSERSCTERQAMHPSHGGGGANKCQAKWKCGVHMQRLWKQHTK